MVCLNIPQKFIIILPIPKGTYNENEETSDDEYSISKTNSNTNTNTNLCLNLPLELEPSYVTTLYVTLNLNIPTCL